MDDMGRVAFNGSLSTDAKVAQLVDICRGFVAQARVPALLDFASFVVEKLGESSPVTHPVLNAFISSLSTLESNDDLEHVCRRTLDLVQHNVGYYAQNVLDISVLISEVQQADEDWLGAAKTLAAVDLETHGQFSPDTKLDVLLRIAELFLAAEDGVSASRYVARAHRLITLATRQELVVRHKSAYARVLDYERKFMEASLRYLSLAQTDAPELVSESDQVEALQHAITCAILAAAGPSRSRVLALLYSDSRVRGLPNFSLLEAMFQDRIIDAAQQNAFKALLKPHQNADLSGGSTVLKRAILEHNMLATSKLYHNIRLVDLSERLNISSSEAEQIACRMIEEGRMRGQIDQIDGIITFDSGNASPLLSWDNQIMSFCSSLNDAADRVADLQHVKA
ncbi:COP9 signalosome complex subunit 4 [Plasmodiophora brassicae]